MESLQQTNVSQNNTLFLKKFVKILEQLNQVSKERMELAYQLVKLDLGHCLGTKAKKILFDNMREILKVVKVEEDPSDCYFIGLHSDRCGYFVGFSYKGNKKIQNLIHRVSDKRLKHMLIDLDDQDNVDEEPFLNYKKSQLQTYQSQQKQNNNVPQLDNNSILQESSSELGELQDLCENMSSIKPLHDHQEHNLGGNRQDQNIYINGKSELVRGNNIYENSKKSEFEKDIEKVMAKLQDTKVHSKQAKEDFGDIPYKEFFERLIYNPNSPLSIKWIGYFLGDFSARWTHPCLFAIREFFHKYQYKFKL